MTNVSVLAVMLVFFLLESWIFNSLNPTSSSN